MVYNTIRICKWFGNGEEEYYKALNNNKATFFDASFFLGEILEEYPRFRPVYFKHIETKKETDTTTRKNIKMYDRLENISQLSGDICFLSGRAIKALLAKYPSNSKYVLCEISMSRYWMLGVPGLIRRKRRNPYIKFKGILKLGNHNRIWGKYWIIMENEHPSYGTEYTLDENLGISGFISYLNEEKIRYVVLRHFENLPRKHREDGDLDILVDDKDLGKVAQFLTANSGRERVGLFGVATPALTNQMPYYIPHLSRRILDNRIEGPASAYIPNQEDHRNSYIYHCLYHKGLLSGIPTSNPLLIPNGNPDNNYKGNIQNLFPDAQAPIDVTMETLDGYLKEVGWRPHLDTLRIIANNNKWLKEHLRKEKQNDNLGINVCIFKKGHLKNSTMKSLCDEFAKYGMIAIKDEIFDKQRAQIAFNSLRGGNWDSQLGEDYLPAGAIVLLDMEVNGSKRNDNRAAKNRIKHVKHSVRKRFDSSEGSFIHITDNTAQAKEYLEVLYPDEHDEIIENIKTQGIDFSNYQIRVNKLNSLAFKSFSINDRLRRKIIGTVSSKINN